MSSSTNAYEMAQAQFDKVADQLGLDQQVRDYLRYPMREFHVRIPVRMDDGTVRVSRVIACSTTMCAVPTRAACALQPTKLLIPFAPWRCG